MTRPNPLTDELTPEAKAILAVKFAEMRVLDRRSAPTVIRRGARSPWELGRSRW